MPVLDKMIGFVSTTDPAKAKAFYGDVLGFRLIGDDDFALVFDANGTMLRIAKVDELRPESRTVIGWQVDDIESTIRALVSRGVRFERYEGLEQDDADPDQIVPPVADTAFLSPIGRLCLINSSEYAALAPKRRTWKTLQE